MEQRERFTFFYSGTFSQWACIGFKVDGIYYAKAEQYMMAEKARIFGDEEIRRKILKTTNPREQKELGRKVKGFDQKIWDQKAREIVYQGNMAKFTQNKAAQRQLLETAGTTLVEASPSDGIWGIGLDAKDPRAQNRDQWLGKNWLGEVLTKVRDDLIKNTK